VIVAHMSVLGSAVSEFAALSCVPFLPSDDDSYFPVFSEMADDDNEVGLPQKGLNMIIKDVLPDMRIANESRELLNQCCAEFVKHLAREAQRISSNDQRKTIYHEHVQKALQNLGFPPDYVEAADSVLDECKIAAEKRLKRKNSRLDKCGIPEEQLYLLQQQLIEKARKEEAEKQAAQFNGLQVTGEGTSTQITTLNPPTGLMTAPPTSTTTASMFQLREAADEENYDA
jgi:histone H3/H4